MAIVDKDTVAILIRRTCCLYSRWQHHKHCYYDWVKRKTLSHRLLYWL